MQEAEARALGALAGAAIAGTAARVADMERAILDRTPARRTGVGAVYEAISRPVHGTIRGVAVAISGAAGAAVGCTRPADAPSLADTRAGALALGALSGICGDRVERDHAALAPVMEVRAGGRRVPAEPAALAAAFPHASPRVAVFVHGLCETEAAWRMHAPATGPATYGERLKRDLGYTPVFIRYNTGLAVDENARRLASLLDAVLGAWPVTVRDVVLVGHSLGGLVALRASLEARGRVAPWVPALRHVVCLASPHFGAPLAKAVHLAAAALALAPETRALAHVLDLRGAGVRDLRLGAVADLPLPPAVGHHAVSASVTRDSGHPLGRVAGDLVVRRASASGHGPGGRRIGFTPGSGHHAGGRTHFHVLNDPEVYRRLLDWLA